MNAREKLLTTANDLVNGDRNAQYGDPRQDFQRTAEMWSAYLGVTVAPHDVAAMMALLKVSRIRWSPEKFDSWVDLAGYAACGWHCAEPPEQELSEERIASIQQGIAEAHAGKTRPAEEVFAELGIQWTDEDIDHWSEYNP